LKFFLLKENDHQDILATAIKPIWLTTKLLSNIQVGRKNKNFKNYWNKKINSQEAAQGNKKEVLNMNNRKQKNLPTTPSMEKKPWKIDLQLFFFTKDTRKS